MLVVPVAQQLRTNSRMSHPAAGGAGRSVSALPRFALSRKDTAMKAFWSSLAVVGLLVATGCNTSTTGGGTGPKGENVGTFKLKGPVTSTTVKHNSDETVKVTVDRSKDFKEDVAFSAAVDPADKGVTATVTPKDVKSGDPGEVSVKVHADEKAAKGDYTVKLTAKPAKGSSTELDFKVSVPEKK
jgi:hypothetical protein